MNKKCIGCGATLQDNNILLEGYTSNLSNDLCTRCFRMRNYGEYQVVTKSNNEYEKLLRKIGERKSLVLYIIDLVSVPESLTKITNLLANNDIVLILNKRDAIPHSVNDNKILAYFKKLNLPFKDMIIVSSLKNYNLDLLMSYIDKYRTDDKVYVVGNTNAGKSTLINRIIKDYTIDQDESITISPLPSTTLNEISIKVKDYFLIDTPGLVDEGNVSNYLDTSIIKKISPKGEIKPRTFQIKPTEALIIGDLFRVDYLSDFKNSFTFFISNDIPIKKINGKKHEDLKNLTKEELSINHDKDLVINGLGFIKIIDPCLIKIYKIDGPTLFVRDSLI